MGSVHQTTSASPGEYEVTLSVADANPLHRHNVTIKMSVGESAAEKAAKEKQTGTTTTPGGGTTTTPGGGTTTAPGGGTTTTPGGPTKPTEIPKPKPLTRAQLLAKALKLCKKEHKSKRAKCEAAARKKYGPKKKHKKK